MIRSLPRQSGFTLLEMMLALVIGAVVMGIGTKLLIDVGRWWSGQQTTMAANRSSWEAAQRIARDIRGASAKADMVGDHVELSLQRALATDFPSTMAANPQARSRVDNDTICFACPNAVRGEKGVDVPGVVWYGIKRESDRVIGLARKAAPTAEALATAPETILSRNCISLSFQYRDDKGQWHDKWSNASATPAEVRITVGALMRRHPTDLGMSRFTTTVGIATGSRIP